MDDLEVVLRFLIRENRRNSYQYNISLGTLIRDHERFMDLLGEAQAKQRNRPKVVTARDVVLRQLRPEVDGTVVGGNGGRMVADIFKAIADKIAQESGRKDSDSERASE